MFKLLPNEDGPNSFDIDVDRSCGLPGIKCETCDDAWARTGIQYPSIECKAVNKRIGSRAPGTVSPEIYRGLISELGDLAGDRVLAPGTGFGPLSGNATGVAEDFVWVNPWTPLVTVEMRRKLEDALGHQLIGSLVHLGSSTPELFEIEIRSLVEVELELEDGWCPECQYRAFAYPETISVVQSHLSSTDFAGRIINFPTIIVVDDLVAATIVDLGCTGVKLERVYGQ